MLCWQLFTLASSGRGPVFQPRIPEVQLAATSPIFGLKFMVSLRADILLDVVGITKYGDNDDRLATLPLRTFLGTIRVFHP